MFCLLEFIGLDIPIKVGIFKAEFCNIWKDKSKKKQTDKYFCCGETRIVNTIVKGWYGFKHSMFLLGYTWLISTL